MSKIALEGNSLGSGTFTIAAPNSNSNPTLTLPTSSGTVVVTGGAQTIEFAAGTAAAPSITFTGDTNTGIFSPGADTIAFSEGGAEAMRIDSSGNVGIGTSSPATPLHVRGANNEILRLQSSDATTGSLYLSYVDSAGTEKGYVGYGSSVSNDFIISNALSGDTRFNTNGSERMRIDSSGNVGIGTSSPSDRLQVNGASAANTQVRVVSTATAAERSSIEFFNNTVSRGRVGGANDFDGLTLDSSTTESAAVIRFRTGGGTLTERARITSGGQFLVGATSASTPTNSTSKIVSQGDFSSVGGEGFGMSVASTTGTGEDHYYISFNTATTTQRGYIYYNNGAGQVQLSATSDARLKENIVDAPSALPVLEQVKVRQYDWKETGNTNIGFVAQELHEVIPRVVAVGQDNEDGTIQRAWGVDNASLVPYLVKAIQELKAITDAQATRIEALEAEVAALKGQ